MDKLLSDNGLIAAADLYYMLGGKTPIRILDATFTSPNGMSPYQAFLGKRIEGAQFFDIDTVADQDAPLPHTLPSEDYFASCVSSMGISNDDHVVVYDQSGAYMASSRAWWMFRTFGHEKVYVLEGGLQSWIAGGFRVVDGPADAPETGSFTAKLNPALIVTRDDLLKNIDTGDIAVLDARPTMRFFGHAPEPRPGMRAGHIPGSQSLPFVDFLNHRSGLFKKNEEIEEILDSTGLDKNAKAAVTCGSGVTACTVALAMFKARGQSAAVYDGSWSEWGEESADTPVEVSA